MYYVYILQSQKDGSFYVGYSADVQNRLEKHNNSRTGYTATRKPWVLVYQEEFPTKTEALIREKFIKSQKSKVYIQSLINSSAG